MSGARFEPSEAHVGAIFRANTAALFEVVDIEDDMVTIRIEGATWDDVMDIAVTEFLRYMVEKMPTLPKWNN